jgi:hypothetical protein
MRFSLRFDAGSIGFYQLLRQMHRFQARVFWPQLRRAYFVRSCSGTATRRRGSDGRHQLRHQHHQSIPAGFRRQRAVGAQFALTATREPNVPVRELVGHSEAWMAQTTFVGSWCRSGRASTINDCSLLRIQPGPAAQIGVRNGQVAEFKKTSSRIRMHIETACESVPRSSAALQ